MGINLFSSKKYIKELFYIHNACKCYLPLKQEHKKIILTNLKIKKQKS